MQKILGIWDKTKKNIITSDYWANINNIDMSLLIRICCISFHFILKYLDCRFMKNLNSIDVAISIISVDLKNKEKKKEIVDISYTLFKENIFITYRHLSKFIICNLGYRVRARADTESTD